MKEKITIIILFIISYIVLYFHFTSPNKIECILVEETDLYQKKQTIILKEKNKEIKEIIQKEKVNSKVSSIIGIKQNEYEKKEMEVKKGKNKITGYKKEKVNKEYEKVLKDLTEAGYTCKK